MAGNSVWVNNDKEVRACNLDRQSPNFLQNYLKVSYGQYSGIGK